MLFTIYNQQGEELRKEEIDTFGIEKTKIVSALVHQVAVAYQANQRRPIAHTKTRGEVSGGGKKPWKQKGTGRARHGSIRSPLWVGGGIIFGPRNTRVFKKAIPENMRRKALTMVVAEKIKTGQVYFIDSLNIPELKTKKIASMIKGLPFGKEKKISSLIVFAPDDGKTGLAVRNLPYAKAVRAVDADTLSLLGAKSVVTTPQAFKILLGRLLKKA